MAVCNITALYQYGSRESLLRRAWKEGRKNAADEDDLLAPTATEGETAADHSIENLLPPFQTSPNQQDSSPALYVQGTMGLNQKKAAGGVEPPQGENAASILLNAETVTRCREVPETMPSSEAPPSEAPPHEAPVSTPQDVPLQEADPGVDSAIAQSIQEISLSVSKRLCYRILDLVLERTGDQNIMPHLHTWLVFLYHIKHSTAATRLLENEFPWAGLAEMLTDIRSHENFENNDKIYSEDFPDGTTNANGGSRPLPEDYVLRGLEWTRKYYPGNFFENAQIDSEERSLELPSMTAIRMERILWLALRICSSNDYLKYNAEKKTFTVHEALERRIVEFNKRLQAAAKKREMTLMSANEDEDTEMTAPCSNSEDEDYVMVGESEEVRKLKERKRQLEAQIKAVSGPGITPETIAEVTRRALAKGPESLRRHYTAFVVDTNLLVSHLDTFNLVIKDWCVVIPNSGMYFLLRTEILLSSYSSGNGIEWAE